MTPTTDEWTYLVWENLAAAHQAADDGRHEECMYHYRRHNKIADWLYTQGIMLDYQHVLEIRNYIEDVLGI